MGAGGVSNRGVEKSYDRNLPKTSKPFLRGDRYKNGQKVQSRWYDENGRAKRNRDYVHGGKHPFPHDHVWDWSKGDGERGQEHLLPDYDNFN